MTLAIAYMTSSSDATVAFGVTATMCRQHGGRSAGRVAYVRYVHTHRFLDIGVSCFVPVSLILTITIHHASTLRRHAYIRNLKLVCKHTVLHVLQAEKVFSTVRREYLCVSVQATDHFHCTVLPLRRPRTAAIGVILSCECHHYCETRQCF